MSAVFRAYAPASAANLSVGFDLLGAALKPLSGEPLGDEIIIRAAPPGTGCELEVSGRFASALPEDPHENIVWCAWKRYGEIMQSRGLPSLDVHLHLKKQLPVCSGLGSSATSVVASVLAVDAINGDQLGDEGRMNLMGELEGKISGSIHYDNVAPCLFGGLQLIINEGGIISRTLPDFDGWYWVSCFPGILVSTFEARNILPQAYPRSTVIAYGRRLAAFVDACHRHDARLAAACLKDVIAEPYRAYLIPKFRPARDFCLDNGAIAAGISGSGSSCFAIFTDLHKAEEAKTWLENNFVANKDGFCHVCTLDRRGAYVEKISD